VNNPRKLTAEVVLAYLSCKYKAYLMLSGTFQAPGPYEEWFRVQDEEYRSRCIRAINDRTNKSLTSYVSENGDTYQVEAAIAEVGVDDDIFALNLDALRSMKRDTPSASKYIPVVFCRDGNSFRAMEALLACWGIVLERIQDAPLSHGIVVCANGQKARIVDNRVLRPKAQLVIDGLIDYLCLNKKPKLWLNSHCRICGYQQRCKSEAKEFDDLSLLNKITEREVKQYNRKGIFTVKQLSYTFRFKKRARRTKSHGRPHSFPLQALAIRENSVYAVSKPDIPDARVRVFVDMEGTSSGDFIYLIGMLIVEADRTSTRSFWANNRKEETGIFVEFANVTAVYENATIFHYGNYETRVFQRMIKLLPANKSYAQLLNNAVNVLSLIYQTIYFPTYSNELKDVGEYLGCKWSGGDAATGLNTIVWRAQWEHFQDAALKERLVHYNQEDCHALNALTSFLYCVPATTEGVKREEGAIQFVEQIKNDDINRKYGKSDYSVKDFGAITERAYFDYQ